MENQETQAGTWKPNYWEAKGYSAYSHPKKYVPPRPQLQASVVRNHHGNPWYPKGKEVKMRLVSAIFGEFHPFDELPGVSRVAVTRDPMMLQEGDVLLVWGGEDISPVLYNKGPSRFSGAKHGISHRDKIEWDLMKRATELNIPIIGVCRGAQMLCALAGGFLMQHVDSHGGFHEVTGHDGYVFRTNSAHHQMMYPWDVEHEMLASIKPAHAKEHYDVDNIIEVKEDPEFVYFPKVNGFAVQWHPEWMPGDCEATKYVFKEFLART